MDHALALRQSCERYRSGEVIADKYRLDRVAGEGGMGSVWVATNLRLDSQVALKLIRHDAHGPGAPQRLLREARAAAQLTHPAIVRVFDFGETAQGDPFIVMELLDGESLRDLLCRTGRLPAEQAVRMVLPIVGGLAAAHARGVIHRDLKPENVFLARDGSGRVQPKLVDFGVAKVVRCVRGDAVTGVGVVGTPEYMAPEQAMAVEVDGRADVWAFFVLLHELIADAYVFSGDSAEATLNAVISDEPPSLLGIAGVDAALWEIVARGLAKDRGERWPSIEAAGRALAGWLLGRGIIDDVCGASLRATYATVASDPRELAIPPAAAPKASAWAAAVSAPEPTRSALSTESTSRDGAKTLARAPVGAPERPSETPRRRPTTHTRIARSRRGRNRATTRWWNAREGRLPRMLLIGAAVLGMFIEVGFSAGNQHEASATARPTASAETLDKSETTPVREPALLATAEPWPVASAAPSASARASTATTSSPASATRMGKPRKARPSPEEIDFGF